MSGFARENQTVEVAQEQDAEPTSKYERILAQKGVSAEYALRLAEDAMTESSVKMTFTREEDFPPTELNQKFSEILDLATVANGRSERPIAKDVFRGSLLKKRNELNRLADPEQSEKAVDRVKQILEGATAISTKYADKLVRSGLTALAIGQGMRFLAGEISRVELKDMMDELIAVGERVINKSGGDPDEIVACYDFADRLLGLVDQSHLAKFSNAN